MRMTVKWPARPDERFRPGAFPIGGAVPVILYDDDDEPGAAVAAGTIVSAEVVDDGRAVHLTIEITEQPPPGDRPPDAGPDVLRRVLKFAGGELRVPIDNAQLHHVRDVEYLPVDEGKSIVRPGPWSATVEGDVAVCGARVTTATGVLTCQQLRPCPDHRARP